MRTVPNEGALEHIWSGDPPAVYEAAVCLRVHGAPSMATDASAITSIVEGARACLQPADFDYFDEEGINVRRYQLATSEYEGLASRVARGHVTGLRGVLPAPPQERWGQSPSPGALFTLTMASLSRPWTGTRIFFGKYFVDSTDRLSVADQLAQLAKLWVVESHAYSAYVEVTIVQAGSGSHSRRGELDAYQDFALEVARQTDPQARRLGPVPGETRLERVRTSLGTDRTRALRQFLVGLTWGMALGPDLCDRLGGQGKVLYSSPCALTEPLGDGVWLQLSRDIPPALADYAAAAAYLAPLLRWSSRDVWGTFPDGALEKQALYNLPFEPVPVRLVRQNEGGNRGLTISVHMRHRLTPWAVHQVGRAIVARALWIGSDCWLRGTVPESYEPLADVDSSWLLATYRFDLEGLDLAMVCRAVEAATHEVRFGPHIASIDIATPAEP